jgi:hypothetical protein
LRALHASGNAGQAGSQIGSQWGTSLQVWYVMQYGSSLHVVLGTQRTCSSGTMWQVV